MIGLLEQHIEERAADTVEGTRLPVLHAASGVTFPALTNSANRGSLQQQPSWVYINSLKESSQRAMLGALRSILQLLYPMQPIRDEDIFSYPWETLRYEQASVILAELKDRYSYTSANARLSALRGVLKQAWLLRLIPLDEYLRAVQIRDIPVNSTPGVRQIEHE